VAWRFVISGAVNAVHESNAVELNELNATLKSTEANIERQQQRFDRLQSENSELM